MVVDGDGLAAVGTERERRERKKENERTFFYLQPTKHTHAAELI